MFKFSIEKPTIIIVAILIVCLFGLLSVFRIPVQMIPDLDVRTISVRTNWPGATPQDVEKEIIIEQEEFLRRIPLLDRMISRAKTGSAEIELEFPHGTDINEALIRVNNALTQVPDYPENVDEPRIITSSFSDNAFMYFRIVKREGHPEDVDVQQMLDFVNDHVTTQIERVPGVSEASVWGGSERQIRIYVDPVKLAERQIRLIDVRNAIRARNRDVSGGDLNSGKRRYLLRTIGRFEKLEDIENMVIAKRGDAFIRLSDIGHTELSNFEVRSYSYANGKANITLGVRRQVGGNVVEIMDKVMAKVDILNQGLLKDKGLVMRLNSEDVRYVKDSISTVLTNLVIGAVLATIVLFIFLRSIPATLIGSIGIPVCTIAAFLGLLLTQRTINVISLAGVAFAIGMTLDNSIVVLENIYRHLSLGKKRMDAVLDGVREVWTAVFASTLTTILVFIPIIFIKDEAGQLYSDIAIAISASILVSMVVAVLVVPSACHRFLQIKPNTSEVSVLTSMGNSCSNAIMGFVTMLMRGVYRRLLLIAAIISMAILIIAYLTPRAEYLPEGEEQKIFALMFAPPGYNIDEMHGILKELDSYFSPYIGDDPEKFSRGETEVPGLNYTISYAQSQSIMFIPEATSRDHVDDLIKVVSRKVNEFPGLISFTNRGSIFAGNLGGSRSINVDISGRSDLPALFDAGFKAFLKSREIFENPQVRPKPSSLTLGQPLLEIHPDWERASELNIDADDLGYTIWAYSDGAYVDEFFQGDDKIDMFIYSTQGTVENPEDIENLLLYSPEGGVIPLNAVANIKNTVNTETIRRVDGLRTITLSIIPPRDIPLELGVELVEEKLIKALKESQEIGDDIQMQISGASDRLKSTRDAMSENFLVAILISYLLLVAIFSHWGYPLIILTSVPIGISGGIVGLWLLNTLGAHFDKLGMMNIYQPFDVITMLGFLVLIGTVVNNPILIVERALDNLRRGLTVADAVIESTRTRLRPIVMSTFTTVFGLSPLVLNPGAGSELYRGLGVIVLFGLLFSTLITLTFIPSVLSLVLQFRESLFASRQKTITES